MKVTKKRTIGGVIEVDKFDDAEPVRHATVDWTGLTDAPPVEGALTTTFPVEDEVKAAATLVRDWLKRYEQWNADAIPVMLRHAHVPDETKHEIFDAYRNSIGILGSLQMAMDLIINGMSVEALVDPVLARAMRSAARTADTPADEDFEADLSRPDDGE